MADSCDLLIVGAGWTAQFLRPLLAAEGITHTCTTRSGAGSTVPFIFAPDSDDRAPFAALPLARTILITFPLRSAAAARVFIELYTDTHRFDAALQFIQLGSTGVWTAPGLSSRKTPIDSGNARGLAEAELLQLGGCVLNLAGLWGGERVPKNWVGRVAGTKEALRGKGSLHLIHGVDVARAVVAVHRNFTPGERWLLTDLRSYDWWELGMAWGSGENETQEKYGGWVMELMAEEGIKVLPRERDSRGKSLSSAEFWERFGIRPVKSLTQEL